MKKILITGGAGFIGSHTADLLLTSGYKVTVFDNLSTGKITNLDLFNTNLELAQADILDFTKLLTYVKRNDAVLHLAALPSVQQSIEDPIQSFKVNTQGFLHVLEAVRLAQKEIRLVYASSAAVYGDAETLPCREDYITQALSPYALEKANNEKYAKLYADLYGIPSLGLRYFNVYGKRQDPKSSYAGVISKFISAYQKQEDILVCGDGSQSRDFICVSDVARANLLALESNFNGVLNIATGVPETLLNLIKCIEQTGKQKASLQFIASRTGDIKASYACIEKAKRELNFMPQHSLENGIASLF